MNGAHDLGGKHCLGAINAEPEDSEPVFHADWERRVFALTLAAGMLGQWNIDESRYARERQHPLNYLQHSYYENWLAGLERLLREKNLLQRPVASLDVPTPVVARRLLAAGQPSLVSSDQPPALKVGQRVRVRKIATAGHTRAPGYVQGIVGTIAVHEGCHVFPDRHVTGDGAGEHLYRVAFSGASLWGSGDDGVEVLVDLWEPYLERLDDDA